MKTTEHIPENAYGILLREKTDSPFDDIAEQLRRTGHCVLDAGYSPDELHRFSDDFNRTWERYLEKYGKAELGRLNELHTIRSPLTHGGEAFIKLALNQNLHAVLSELILGKYILNQQNGLINPPDEPFSQGMWHRDLPYQHFVSTRSLAINALFCVDDFTTENGATFVLPSSHKFEAFPSPGYIEKNAIQIEAKAGSFILLDCMVFHAGGFNRSKTPRRAVNHVYTIPYLKQQINIPMNMANASLTTEAKEIFGFNNIEPISIDDYFAQRDGRKY